MKPASDLHVGIDLGTTNSVISYLKDGRPVPIAIDGDTIVPSVVHLDRTGTFRVGREARNLELSEPERTVRSVKRKMGQGHRYEIDGRELLPEEVSAEILSALKQGAEKTLGHSRVSKAGRGWWMRWPGDCRTRSPWTWSMQYGMRRRTRFGAISSSRSMILSWTRKMRASSA